MSEQEIEAMKGLICEIASMDPYAYNDNSGVSECVFCDDFYGWGVDDKHTQDHEKDCTYLKAVTMVKQWEQEKGTAGGSLSPRINPANAQKKHNRGGKA